MKSQMHYKKSVNLRSSPHTEGDRCQQISLHILVDGTLNFNFLWTASKYVLQMFDNFILKMVKLAIVKQIGFIFVSCISNRHVGEKLAKSIFFLSKDFQVYFSDSAS